MGYPMTYKRVITRASLISSDLRRLETDTLDDKHLSMYAEAFGCTVEQARAGFRVFFGYTNDVSLYVRHFYPKQHRKVEI